MRISADGDDRATAALEELEEAPSAVAPSTSKRSPAASGTVGYTDPEIVAEQLRPVPASDLYSLGAMLYEALTPHEFLEFVAGVRRLDPAVAASRARNLVTAFRLIDEFEEPIATLSNGTRQKVLIVAALLHQPPLLVLDEPLNHLDPRSLRLMKDLLAQYVRNGTRGVLFSTHAMEIAEQLCHRVGILDHGLLRGEGSLASLRERGAEGDASLEQIFLHLTQEDEGVREALASLERA